MDCAMIADISSSRTGSEERREDLSRLLEESRLFLNGVFKKSLKQEMVFSGGDSIQGLFNNLGDAFLYGRLLQKIFNPETIRVGLSVGETLIVWDNKNSKYSTGKAYINAQKAVKAAKEENIKTYLEAPKSFDINILLEAIAYIQERHTEYYSELDLITEILFPLVSDSMDLFRWPLRICELVTYKNQLTTFQISKKRNQENSRIDILIDHFTRNSQKQVALTTRVYIDRDSPVNPRGISTMIADTIDVTKSSISQYMKSSKILKLREFDAIVYNKLKGIDISC
jgi:hypothetical protein